MDPNFEKLIAWIDDRDVEAEEWLNDRAAERFNLVAATDKAAYIQSVLASDLLPD